MLDASASLSMTLLYCAIVLAKARPAPACAIRVWYYGDCHSAPLGRVPVSPFSWAFPALLIDLHTHSYPKSDDSFVSVDDLIDRAKSLGLDGICLTEHDTFWAADDIKDLCRRHDFTVLPGCEINTDAGHILVFGLEEYVFGLHKPAFLRHAVNKRGGVMIAAHPYRRRYLGEPGIKADARAEMLQRALEDDVFLMCDAVEGHNGRGREDENEFSLDIGSVFALPPTAGSDSHRVEQMGTVATRFERTIRSLDDLIKEIKAGRFAPEALR